MRLVHRIGLLFLCLALSAVYAASPLPEAKPEEVGISGPRLERLSEVLKQSVDSGELPGVAAFVARKGKIVYAKSFGMQDQAKRIPMANDSIFRLYSMTKPIVSVAAMTFIEEGKFGLHDPVSKFLPEFKDMQVGVDTVDPKTNEVSFSSVPAKKPITIQDLMRHTSGLTYGPPVFDKSTVHKKYKEAGIWSQKWVLADFTKALAKLPLAYEPGSTFEYSHSTDVLGRVIEVVSGKTLDVVLQERVLGPLKMNDTAFHVPQEKHARIAEPMPDKKTGVTPDLIDVRQPATFFAGGHGLVGTLGDYLRFCQMLLNNGELDGVRILGRKTIEHMTANHIGPNIGVGTAWIPTAGYGFGLGFGVRKEAGLSEWPSSVGEYFWGGYAGTFFWVDPKEQIVAVMGFQDPTRRQSYRPILREMVYQALE